MNSEPDNTTVSRPDLSDTGTHQKEMPFAMVLGEPVNQLPHDLYIPPDALEVFLDAFEGPLDLLLYLIRRQNLNILDIPVAEITSQYVQYIELMKEMRLELAAEYLVMAAMLTEIKSRMLLPRPEQEGEEEDDPRAELIMRLQQYERFKQAAEDINALPRIGRDVYKVDVDVKDKKIIKLAPVVSLHDMLFALQDVLNRAEMYTHHYIQMEPLSVRERMSSILNVMRDDNFVEFTALFTIEEGRRGVIVTLLAILELLKESLIEMIQNEPFSSIHVKAARTFEVTVIDGGKTDNVTDM